MTTYASLAFCCCRLVFIKKWECVESWLRFVHQIKYKNYDISSLGHSDGNSGYSDGSVCFVDIRRVIMGNVKLRILRLGG